MSGSARGTATQAEIAVLEALADQGELISARTVPGAPRFHGRLVSVDRGGRCLVIARSGDRAADDFVLGQACADFFVEWGEWRIAFAGERPEAVTHEGCEAIRVELPETVAISRRRMFERSPVPADALRCIAYSGAVPIFEAIVTDISRGGIGIRIDSADGALQPGMVLPGCRIVKPGHAEITADLEVRHTAAISAPDGSRAVRAGCRFVNLSQATMALVAEFSGTKAARPRPAA